VAAAAAGLSLLGSVRAQGAPTEGKDYIKVSPPVPVTPPPGKVEVIEFFSFACPHCFALKPTLEAWTKRLPASAHFHRIPVPFLFNADNFQRIYFTLEAMNLVEAMQLKVFNAVHIDHQHLDSPESIGALMTKNGIDAAKFLAVFNSFGMHTKVAQAKQLVEAYKLDQVPMLAVQGRFMTSPGHAGGGDRALQVADWLIQQAAAGH